MTQQQCYQRLSWNLADSKLKDVYGKIPEIYLLLCCANHKWNVTEASAILPNLKGWGRYDMTIHNCNWTNKTPFDWEIY